MLELKAIFHGNVQGVGFRMTAQQIARSLNLKGTVKNLPNGSVELLAQGEKEPLDQLLYTSRFKIWEFGKEVTKFFVCDEAQCS